jgi:pimeloyl-ACP methyl ester carboxylesterase
VNPATIFRIALAVVAAAVVGTCYGAPQLSLEPARNLVRGQAGFDKHETTADGERVVYLEGGHGDPVVLLHGLGGNKDAWDGFGKIITPSNHVFALDLPGFGDSARNENGDYGYAAQVARLEKIVRALGLRRFHLVGHSMGGGIAGLYAASHPDDVQSLALIASTGLKPTEPSEYQKLLEKKQDPLTIHETADFNRMLAFLFDTPPEIPGIVARGLAKEALRNAPFNRRVGEKLFTADPSFLESTLGKLTMPVFVLWCDHDRIIHPSTADLFRRSLPSASVHMMKGCGHLPHTERPDEAGRLYHGFLDEVRLTNERPVSNSSGLPSR